MKQINLPKWAVVNGLGTARLIHMGNGVFVSADTQTPAMFESCVPEDQASEAPTGVAATTVEDFQPTWKLGQFPVTTEAPLPQEASPADALNAEANAPAETQPEAAPAGQ